MLGCAGPLAALALFMWVLYSQSTDEPNAKFKVKTESLPFICLRFTIVCFISLISQIGVGKNIVSSRLMFSTIVPNLEFKVQRFMKPASHTIRSRHLMFQYLSHIFKRSGIGRFMKNCCPFTHLFTQPFHSPLHARQPSPQKAGPNARVQNSNEIDWPCWEGKCTCQHYS